MSKFIDLEKIKPIDFPSVEMDGLDVVRHLNTLPTVDAVEVVHAEWLDIRFDPMWSQCWQPARTVRSEVRVKSNECGFAVPDSDYCPNCGAKIGGDKNGS